MKKLIVASICLLASAAFAKQYGEAGCGLGSMVMGAQGNQVLAATTNNTSGTQLYGITTGTSNCTDGGTVKSAKQIPAYIEINKLALAKDAARGEGETLAGLANLMGCDAKSFGSALKSSYNKVFVETNMQPALIQSNIEAMKAQACGA